MVIMKNKNASTATVFLFIFFSSTFVSALMELGKYGIHKTFSFD